MAARTLDAEAGTLPLDGVTLLSPVTRNQQFVCQAVNYRSHMRESGIDPDQHTRNVVFTKASSSMVAANAEVAALLSSLRPSGAYVSIAHPTLTLLDRHGLVLGGLRVLAARAERSRRARPARHRWALFRSDATALAAVTDEVERGRIRPVIDRVFPLGQIAEAQRYIETGHARGKVVLSI